MPNNGGGVISQHQENMYLSFNNICTNNKTVNIVTADTGVYYCALLSLRTFSTSPNAMVCTTQTPSPAQWAGNPKQPLHPSTPRPSPASAPPEGTTIPTQPERKQY